MTVELGHFALVLAFAVACFQMIVPLRGALKSEASLMATAVPAAISQFVLIGLSFFSLTWAYVNSDFSVHNVWSNSHSAKPLVYKISGVWGNHEGSMLLWVLILASFGAAVAIFSRNLPLGLKARVLAVQGSISVAFMLFILTVSNPFARIGQVPIEGKGLNPILQDPALAIHPPLLYMGYVGLSVAFSFAIAALIEGRVDAAWARWVRPWTLAAWMFLTLGIAMGSWWAYYELGWGGWWFWDPVENASFMPWLIATALLHSATVVEKRNALKIWTVLLSILAFSMSLLGTFLVRSGVLTSVHAFAVDPGRGLFILCILGVFIGGSLTLYAFRAHALTAGGLFSPISREGALVVNNLLLASCTVAVLIGTLYPLLHEVLTGSKISVGPPYFNLTFGLLVLPLLLLVPIGPMLTWKRADGKAAVQRLWLAAVLAAIAAIFAFVIQIRGPWLAPLGIALGVWLVVGSLIELARKIQLFKTTFSTSMARLFGLPGQALGMTLAHVGVGIMVLGVVAITAWKIEKIATMKPGDKVEIAGVVVTFKSEEKKNGPNYSAESGTFLVTTPSGDELTTLISEKRTFLPRGQNTSEVGIYPFWTGDLYITMGERPGGETPEAKISRTVRVYFNPLVNLIWLGAIIMFLGGLLSLADRRHRVGAPRPSKKSKSRNMAVAGEGA